MAEGKGNHFKIGSESVLNPQAAYVTDDQLIVLEGLFRQRARRIDLRDVEALVICPTKSAMAGSLILFLFIFMMLLVTASNFGSMPGWISAVVTVLLVVALVYRVRQKGSVLFAVQTAVQTVVLNGIGTVRKAERTKWLLKERIEAVQGRLEQDALDAHLHPQGGMEEVGEGGYLRPGRQDAAPSASPRPAAGDAEGRRAE